MSAHTCYTETLRGCNMSHIAILTNLNFPRNKLQFAMFWPKKQWNIIQLLQWFCHYQNSEPKYWSMGLYNGTNSLTYTLTNNTATKTCTCILNCYSHANLKYKLEGLLTQLQQFSLRLRIFSFPLERCTIQQTLQRK